MKSAVLFLLFAVGAALIGCQPAVHFPAGSMQAAAEANGAFAAFDTNNDGKADFYYFADAAGRVNRIGYDTADAGKPNEIVELDKIPFSKCRHLIIILDGFGYEVVKKYYDEGHFRICHTPSRTIAPYPTLTDPSIEDALGYKKCRGPEAMYFDPNTGKIEGGNDAYMKGENEPYNELLTYRAKSLMDVIGYMSPWWTFNKELDDSMQEFQKNSSHDFLVYYVSSAGVGTAKGEAGQRDCLAKVEPLVNQVMWQSHGQLKVTLLADHGHSYTPSTQAPLEEHLKSKGYRIVNALEKPKDVAYVRFGLVTYAAFGSKEPEQLAKDLIDAQSVELASFAQGREVVVLGKDGARAVIREKSGRYGYEATAGDPLKVKDALAKLKADSEGYYGEAEMLAATIDNYYPAPLERVWRAHSGLVENTPSVIVSLVDNYYNGSSSFAGMVKVASTHGGLNKRNSTAFIMSSMGALPPFMTSKDVPANMEKMTGQKWPLRK